MAKRMLIDAAHPEETRVVVLNGHRLEEFDFESSTKKQIKGNIYLAKVTRVEPSLQAAFVEYGGNRHGFLAFNEIHPDYYRIPVGDRRAQEARDARARELAEDARRADAADVAGEAPEESRPEDDVPAEPAYGESAAAEAEDTPAMPAEAARQDVLYDNDRSRDETQTSLEPAAGHGVPMTMSIPGTRRTRPMGRMRRTTTARRKCWLTMAGPRPSRRLRRSGATKPRRRRASASARSVTIRSRKW
jgi:ribonuclease E